MRAKPGDVIVIDSVHTNETTRRGIVVDVRETGGVEHYVVRWDDGRETTFYPGSTAHTVQVPAP